MFPIFLFFNRHDDEEEDYEPEWYPEIPNWLYYSIITIFALCGVALLYWAYKVCSTAFL